jgi:hypothetical protein
MVGFVLCCYVRSGGSCLLQVAVLVERTIKTKYFTSSYSSILSVPYVIITYKHSLNVTFPLTSPRFEHVITQRLTTLPVTTIYNFLDSHSFVNTPPRSTNTSTSWLQISEHFCTSFDTPYAGHQCLQIPLLSILNFPIQPIFTKPFLPYILICSFQCTFLLNKSVSDLFHPF